MISKRINVSINPQLHRLAVLHARKVHYTDLSGLITKLLVADLRAAHASMADVMDETTRQAQIKKTPASSNRGT